MRLRVVSAASLTVIAVLSLVACQRSSGNTTAANSTTVTNTLVTERAPGSEPGANTPPAANSAPSTNAAPPPTNSAATNSAREGDRADISDTNIPPECQAYINAVQACVDHMSNSSPGVAEQVRQQMDQQRRQWAGEPNRQGLATACRAATNNFNSSAHTMGC
jgi:hypothetical protein